MTTRTEQRALQLARIEAKLAALSGWLRATTWLLLAILVVLTYEAVMVTP